MTVKKDGLRQVIRQRKLQYSRQQLWVLSRDVISHLMRNDFFRRARTLLLYNSLPDEVDTSALLRSLTGTTTILLPKVIDAENMELRLYTGSDGLVTGSYGIGEPTGTVFTDFSLIDVAVIPGMAFDRNCHRLGRGRGYYDRLLPLMPEAHKIGLCFGFQIVENLPHEPHDIAMDEVIF